MKIAIMSDLHLESERGPISMAEWKDFSEHRADTLYHPRIGPMIDSAIGVDLVIMAGDIDVGDKGISYASEVSDYIGCPVVYVAGNHEFFGHHLFGMIDQMRYAASMTNGRVIFLEDASAVIDGIHVLGSTLWTDYAANGVEKIAISMDVAQNGLNDHLRIRHGRRRLSAADARRKHAASRSWMNSEISKLRGTNPDAIVVIVTHHAPTIAANAPQFRGGPISPAFVNDMRQEIVDWCPALWAFGHTHFDIDEKIGTTRLISRQRGNVDNGGRVLEFRPIVVEI